MIHFSSTRALDFLGMGEIRRADPAARRRALLLTLLAALAGTVLIASFGRYDTPLREWLLSEPEQFVSRALLVFSLLSAAVMAPLAAFSIYLWSFGAKVLREQEFPPPGYRVIRDTPVLRGHAAASRGRGLKALALGLAIASAILLGLLWRLARTIVEGRG